MKLLIKRGRLVDPVGGIGGTMDLLIENGKVAGLGSDLGSEADRIIEEIRKTFDVTKRIELCHEFHRIIHEEQPYTFLMVPEQLSILSGDLENVRCFPLGLESDTFWINRPTQ